MRVVIFDLDGVLVDSEPLYEAAFESYLQQIGQSADADLFSLTVGRRDVDFLPELSARLGRPASEVQRGLQQTLEARLDQLEPMPFAGETVRGFQEEHRAVGLATSSNPGFVRHALRGLDLEHEFETVVTGDEVVKGKPHPAIYRLAAERLGFDCQACVAIEDSPAGVASAQAAGMTCIAIPHALSPSPDLTDADHLVVDLREAAALVRRLERDPL